MGWIAGISASLGTILLQMLIKTIGYEFVSKAAIILAKEWAKTTKSEHDDEIVAAWEKAIRG